MKLRFLAAGLMGTGLVLSACHNEKGVPQRDDRVQTERGTPGATPNKEMTVSNSSQQTSVPREGGSLDRGVSKDNDPSRNAPGPNGTALNERGPGHGTTTK